MSLSKVMPSPRRAIHLLSCVPIRACRFDENDAGTGEASVWCKKLDELLDFNDEQLLHVKARDLQSRWEQMNTRARNAHGPGAMWAVREIDPYDEVDADGVIDMLSSNAEVVYEDCPECEKGTKHHHRKSDGSLVQLAAQGQGD